MVHTHLSASDKTFHCARICMHQSFLVFKATATSWIDITYTENILFMFLLVQKQNLHTGFIIEKYLSALHWQRKRQELRQQCQPRKQTFRGFQEGSQNLLEHKRPCVAGQCLFCMSHLYTLAQNIDN